MATKVMVVHFERMLGLSVQILYANSPTVLIFEIFETKYPTIRHLVLELNLIR
jgi:hypothetical protein